MDTDGQAPFDFYSHVNYSVTKMVKTVCYRSKPFYSHVNYSVTKIQGLVEGITLAFYSHVNYSVTKIYTVGKLFYSVLLQSRKLFSY